MTLTAAAFVVVIAGVSAAKSIVVPLLVAAFVAVILTPLLRWLERRGLPTGVAVLVIVVAMLALGTGVLALVGASGKAFADMSQYQEDIRQNIDDGVKWMTDHGLRLPEEEVPGWFDPQSAVKWFGVAAGQLISLLSLTLIVTIAAAFMLLESSRFPAKVKTALGKDHAAVTHLGEILDTVRRYMVIKTWTSFLTGLLVTIFTWLMGIPYAPLWGLLAFFLNYIPFIGSTSAGVPAVLLAWVKCGTGMALGTIVGYVAINSVISNVVEPLFMGQGLGLSTLVVFISIVFWGWVLGPIGMLLATPMTMVGKIVLAEYEETRWIAELVSSKAPSAEGA